MFCAVGVWLLNLFILLRYQVAEAEEQTAGGLLLTQATKEKPSVGTVSILGLVY
jgi:co-chaperonin GroES (HSP10)